MSAIYHGTGTVKYILRRKESKERKKEGEKGIRENEKRKKELQMQK